MFRMLRETTRLTIFQKKVRERELAETPPPPPPPPKQDIVYKWCRIPKAGPKASPNNIFKRCSKPLPPLEDQHGST